MRLFLIHPFVMSLVISIRNTIHNSKYKTMISISSKTHILNSNFDNTKANVVYLGYNKYEINCKLKDCTTTETIATQ